MPHRRLLASTRRRREQTDGGSGTSAGTGDERRCRWRRRPTGGAARPARSRATLRAAHPRPEAPRCRQRRPRRLRGARRGWRASPQLTLWTSCSQCGHRRSAAALCQDYTRAVSVAPGSTHRSPWLHLRGRFRPPRGEDAAVGERTGTGHPMRLSSAQSRPEEPMPARRGLAPERPEAPRGDGASARVLGETLRLGGRALPARGESQSATPMLRLREATRTAACPGSPSR